MRTSTQILTITLSLFVFACGTGNTDEANQNTQGEPIENGTQTEEEITVSDDPMQNKGVGSITNVTLGDIDASLVEKGKNLFEGKCSACHKMDARAVGPALADVTGRRSPEWIMNMILDPEKMTKEDPIAKGLFEEFMTPMANQSLTEEEARSILEYFRDYDKQ